jgi:hypothetical protein
VETLAFTHSYASYEEVEGIEYDWSEVELDLPKVPNSAWLGLLGIAVLFGSLGVANPASAAYYVKTNGSCLRTRWGPGSNYKYAGMCVRNGAALKPVVETKNGWAKLSSGRWVNATWITQTPGTTKPPTNGGAVGGNLKRGATGESVKSLQTRLRAIGYYKGSIDGVFGAQTEQAVRNFQAKQGILVDGIVGRATRAELEKVDV